MQILPKATCFENLKLPQLKLCELQQWCTGTAHSFPSLLWFPMEWQKQGIGYWRASHMAVPPYIFPTIPCCKVIFNRMLYNNIGKISQFVFENPKYHQIHVLFLTVVSYWQKKPYYERDVCFCQQILWI